MRRWLVESFGNPTDIWRLEEDAEEFEPGPDQLKIAVEAAGLGLPDVLMCNNNYPLTPPLPFTPSQEAAGEVVAVGANALAQRFFLRAFLVAARCFFLDLLSLGLVLVAEGPGSSGGKSGKSNGKPVPSLSADFPMPNSVGLFIAAAILVAASSVRMLRHRSACSD